ncbi:MAG: type II secretion system F family protein [Candidatus Omnitrophica bacterium]|nr:type II secretion system F family protein [Candidatus Omnitrophota bacterium]
MLFFLFLIFIAVTLFLYGGIPFIIKTTMEVNKKRAKNFAREMDRTMIQEDIRKVSISYIVGPFVLGVAGFVLFQMIGAAIGAVIGFIIPKVYANMLIQQRKKQFESQLIDALMIMSSSFRGGLSLIQSMEAVVEEMPEPIRQEFGIVLGENKMGVSLDEAMNRLYKRMPSPALQQMVSAILLARETGGNLPLIFSRIVGTIRERKKIEENLYVLTLQGKLQAVVMSGLPIGFFFMVNATNPQYFRMMTTTEIGRTLLIICAFLWVIGTAVIIKISSFKDA